MFLDNIWASLKAKELGLRAMNENQDLQLRFLPSMVRRGRLFTHCMDMIREDGQVPVLDTPLTLRNASPECQVFGTTVHAAGRAAQPAINEVEAMVSSVLRLLNIRG